MKSCRICTNSAEKFTEPKPHKCMIDWIESSKSMECEGIVNLCIHAPKNRYIYIVHKLVIDDDTNMHA